MKHSGVPFEVPCKTCPVGRRRLHPAPGAGAGFTLLELMIALALTAFLLLSIVQVFAAAKASYRTQDAISRVQESSRFVSQFLMFHMRHAGYVPVDVADSKSLDSVITADTADGGAGGNDVLSFAYFADNNCAEQPNPVVDAFGNPAFYVKQLRFSVDAADNLIMRCEYGRTQAPADLAVQINNAVVVEGVDTFQVLYGEDVDFDESVDRWVPANQWDDELRIIAAQFGLLLRSPEQATGVDRQTYNVLGTVVPAANDGLIRKPALGVSSFRNLTP